MISYGAGYAHVTFLAHLWILLLCLEILKQISILIDMSYKAQLVEN